MEKKNILITGGAGFIGYHLAKSYKNNLNYSVYLVDDFSRGEYDKHLENLIDSSDNIKIIQLDLSNKQDCWESNVFKRRYEIIYHLAATNGTNNFYKYPSHVLANNIISTFNVLNMLSIVGCVKFIFASSCETYYGAVNLFDSMYLPTEETVPLVVDDITNKRTSYGISKIACESLVVNKCNEKCIPWNILRYHNIYGERMGMDGHVIPDLIAKGRTETFIKVSNAYSTRSFTYVEDAIRDTRLIAHENYQPISNEIFNVGIEKETTILKLAEMIRRLMSDYFLSSIDLKIDKGEFHKGSVKRRLPDMTKFNNYIKSTGIELQYTSLEEGLRKTFDWYMCND